MSRLARSSSWTFQSTPPRRGDSRVLDAACPGILFQSTPPRRGDSFCKGSGSIAQIVSIHAPAKGRRTACRPGSRMPGGFNPRPREGATTPWWGFLPLSGVSIHAPAKGRRRSAGMTPTCSTFQSTPPRRGDKVDAAVVRREFEFQSTPPRRGDITVLAAWLPLRSFNPRPREGATTVTNASAA